LRPAVIESRIIPYGIDLAVFQPGDRDAARAALNIRRDARMLLFVANRARGNLYKDYATIRATLEKIARALPDQPVLCIALGDDSPEEHLGNAVIRFVPFEKDPKMVARYYQAADVYLHAARADTFPNAVLEALACGTPVVATAVGGIPEQVKGLAMEHHRCAARDLNRYGPDEATGALVPVADASAMGYCIQTLLDDE